MKKNLFFAMMAICVMASCSKDSDVAGGSDNDQEHLKMRELPPKVLVW